MANDLLITLIVVIPSEIQVRSGMVCRDTILVNIMVVSTTEKPSFNTTDKWDDKMY